MSRIPLTLAAASVSLALVAGGGAAAQPAPPPGYQAQGYPPAGAPPGSYPPPPEGYPPPPPGAVYVAPGYPPPPPGQPYIGPDGLTYVNGGPVYYVGGNYFPLVFVAGLGWGYYGFGHRFFGAPGPLGIRLEHFYPGGRGFPYRGGPGFRGPGFHGPGFHGPDRGPGAFHGDHDFRR